MMPNVRGGTAYRSAKVLPPFPVTLRTTKKSLLPQEWEKALFLYADSANRLT